MQVGICQAYTLAREVEDQSSEFPNLGIAECFRKPASQQARI